ncbi:calponin homology domain-containing protein DDB_G0272472-like isoform X2 [Plodia interpunctella]|uniref:calponin homology domain-containing protein DDB_G0272472-like isoform X2 n=1 Tax=Plodia interpunctella TaxID=58824 RepID=UPI002367BE69|nr:calponin homology domain-containing protein DDB_G0272472-like isoform X2 [Plodia interpunctella]
MWSGGGMKIDLCPCCKVVSENYSGFQKVLDVRDAGFVLYRHTTLVEDIDKSTGTTQIATTTTDDVFILENTKDVPLKNVDITTELDRNQISCPRCVNIVKHAQKLLQNQELGANDLIGVCEHCRQKNQAEKPCLKCKEAVEIFQSNKAAKKTSSRAQKVKTWLSKIENLIRKALVEDKKQAMKIKRRYSDIDINLILKKMSKTDREPEVAELFLHDIDSSMLGPLSDRSHYHGVKKTKDVMFDEIEKIYEDRRHPGTPYGEESRLFNQSITTLTEDEFERRYKKDKIEDNTVYDYMHTPRADLAEENYYGTSKEDFIQAVSKQYEHDKQFISKSDTFQDGKKYVTGEGKHYESDRMKSLIQKRNFDYEDNIPTISTRYESGGINKDLLDNDIIHIKSKEYVPDQRKDYPAASTKYYDSNKNKVLTNTDSDIDSSLRRDHYDRDRKKDRRTPDTVSDHRKERESDDMTSKYYHSDEKKYLPKSDSVSDHKKRVESSKYYDRDKKGEVVQTTSKYYDSDRGKDLVSDHRMRGSVTTDSKYHDGDKNRDVLKADTVSDDRKPDIKYYGSDKKRDILKSDTVSDDRTKRDIAPTGSKYDDIDRNKDSRGRKESDVTEGKYYDSGKPRDILKSETVSDDKKKREAVPGSKYDDSGRRRDTSRADSVPGERRGEFVVADSKYDSERKRDILKADTVSDERKIRGALPTGSKYDDSERRRDTSRADSVPHDRRKESVVADSKYYGKDKKRDALQTDAVSDDRKKKEAIKYDYSDRKKESFEADGVADDRRRKEYALTSSKRKDMDEDLPPYIDHSGRRKEYTSADDENYETGKKKEIISKAGTRHEEEKEELAKKNKAMYTTQKARDFEDVTRHAPAPKQYEGERGQGFISRIGKKFEEKYKLDFGDIEQVSGFKDIKRLTEVFIPLAVRRYTQDVSAILQPIGGLRDKRSIKSTITKIAHGPPSRMKKYHSDESLFSGISKMTDMEGPTSGFDYFFPHGAREVKKKIRRTKSVSSSELIKDTLDKLEEEKKKREEAERIKEEHRKQLEAERKERELAKRIERDLEKQLKLREKEIEQELKMQAAKGKISENEVDVKDTVQELDRKIETAKVDDVGKTKKPKSNQDLVRGKDATVREGKGKVKEEKVGVKEDKEGIKEEKEGVQEEKKGVKEDKGKGKEDKGRVKEDKGRVKEEKGQVEDERGKAKDETGKIKEETGKNKEEKGKLKEETGKVKDEMRKDTETTEKKTKGETLKEKEDKQNKIIEEKAKSDKTAKEIGDKSNEKKTKDSTLDKDKLKPENAVKSDERERLMKELKQQKEEERKKEKIGTKDTESTNQPKAGKEKKKEVADQEVSGKKGKDKKEEIVKSENVSDQLTKQKHTVPPDKKKALDVPMTGIKMPKRLSIYDLVVPKDRPKERKKEIPSDPLPMFEVRKRPVMPPASSISNLSDLELDLESLLNKQQEEINMKKNEKDIVIGEKIHKFISHGGKTKEENIKDLCREKVRKIREKTLRNEQEKKEKKIVESRPIDYDEDFGLDTEIAPTPQPRPAPKPESKPEKLRSGKVDRDLAMFDPDYGKGVVRYALSDRSFIEKGWTMLPTEKVVRKMNVYRMRPSHPEFDWFERNKKKGVLEYDSGEKLAQFDDNGRGRLYYKSGNLALDYYNAEAVASQTSAAGLSRGPCWLPSTILAMA